MSDLIGEIENNNNKANLNVSFFFAVFKLLQYSHYFTVIRLGSLKHPDSVSV